MNWCGAGCCARRDLGCVLIELKPVTAGTDGYVAVHAPLAGGPFNAQTGNLSPLVAAGLFYLALTVPLTHLVNFIDARLRKGRAPAPEDPLAR